MGHDHAGDVELDLPSTTGRVITAITIVLALATVIGMVVLWPDGSGRDSFEDLGYTKEYHDAVVVSADERPCESVPEGYASDAPVCATYVIRVLDGPDAGLEITQEVFDLRAGNRFTVGEQLVLGFNPSVLDVPAMVPNQTVERSAAYSIADRDRRTELVWLAVLFAVIVVLLGRLRGLAALGGLVVTVVLLLVFTLPAIIDGSDALAVAIVSASAIAFCAIYLAHGVSTMTTVAVLGTLGALVLTAVLATVFTGLTRLTGFASEESAYLVVGGADISISGLVLAGIVIGALGAIDDMTVTQVSSVAELRRANPAFGMRDLYRSANRIGQDHVASTVNTLVLAYAGASMPLLVLLAVTDQPLASVANGELIATEIVRTLVGSIGLVCAVPITTLLAALVVQSGRRGSSVEVEE